MKLLRFERSTGCRKGLSLGLLLSAWGWAASGCVSNEQAFSDRIAVEAVTDAPDSGEPRYVQEEGLFAAPKDRKVQWFSCTQGAGVDAVVLLNPPETSFQKGQVCQHPVVSEFLAQGFNVVAINRPGHGESSGTDFWGDDEAVASATALVSELQGKGFRVSGLWAYGEASLQGFRMAKTLPLKFLLIGNGIYDWEELLKKSQDPQFSARVRKIQSEAGEGSAFAEKRSIAWDFNGLPKEIYLYHNHGNLRVLPSEASAFKNSLAAGEYKVELLVLDQEGASLPAALHRGLIKKLGERLRPSRAAGS